MMMHPSVAESMVRQHRADLVRDAEQARLVRIARTHRRVPRRSLASSVRAGWASIATARSHARTRHAVVPAHH